MSTAVAGLTLENVLYEKKNAIACVTFNRPKVLNALNKAIVAELKATFEDARDDSAVRGVILTGAGDKAFAAGADISEILSDTPLEAARPECVYERSGYARPRSADRVAESTCSAIDVDARMIQTQVAHRGHGHDRKGLVDLV